MAADVRDSESDTITSDTLLQKDAQETDDIVSTISSSDSRTTLNSEISSIPNNEKENPPSYVIVQKQMKDALFMQRAAVQQLVRSNIDALNTSKLNFSISYESQEEKIKQLELSIQNDFVSREEYVELKKKFKEECEQHGKTKSHLSEACDRLSATQQQLAEMEVEMKQGMEDSDTLRDKLAELQEQNSKLHFLLQERTLQYEEMKSQVLEQSAQIEKQTKKHEQQKTKLKQKVTEAEIERQQQAYLSRMLTEKNTKKKKL